MTHVATTVTLIVMHCAAYIWGTQDLKERGYGAVLVDKLAWKKKSIRGLPEPA